MRRPYLFERHPFIAAAGSVVDLFGVLGRPDPANIVDIYYDPIERRQLTDDEALYNDWLAIGDDFGVTILVYNQAPDLGEVARQEPLFELA